MAKKDHVMERPLGETAQYEEAQLRKVKIRPRDGARYESRTPNLMARPV